MITKQKTLFYFVAGKPYASLEEAQKVDLLAMLPPELGLTKDGIADWMLKNADTIVATLTTTSRSRVRKPRSDIGKPRKKKNAPEPAAP